MNLHQESPKLVPIVTNVSANAAFDYLYEFSETRKVLEEFFKPSSPLPLESDFAELEYNLHRQAGNSYVGQRLAAKDYSDEPAPPLSPRGHQPGGTPDLISLGDTEDLVSGAILADHSTSAIERSLNLLTHDPDVISNNADEDLAETEVSSPAFYSLEAHANSFLAHFLGIRIIFLMIIDRN